ncbi:serine hydrolase domain-containing protein [Streptomyces griseoaurantiacus]|uniref:serine hydrolase domain-containing protein n=1 Tax=Streptomyces griseoaurantiacus TaxID=68213 RepID=UPI0037ADC793
MDGGIGGGVEEGFGPLADEFVRNFTERGEIGAAFAVYQNGRKVVDLWGGYRDRHRHAPWAEDTMVTVYSSTKGVAGLLIARARDRGQIDYDRPVADYWPEFAAHGKSGITVRQLLAHQAGLSALSRPISLAELRDPTLRDALLADATPLWAPGSRHGYHAATIGFYEDALLRRVDPRHRSLGTVLTEDVRTQGAEFYIGVPGDVSRERIATIHGFDNAELAEHIDEMPAEFVAALNDPSTLTGRTFTTNQATAGLEAANQPEVLALELPSGNGTGQVRSIAALYADALMCGPLLGLTSGTLDDLAAPVVDPSEGRRDLVLHVDTNYSLGFWKPFDSFRFGSEDGRAFGCPGAGGSFAFADPTTGVGFAYAPNRSGFRIWDDPRELALRDALFSTVLGQASQRPRL